MRAEWQPDHSPLSSRYTRITCLTSERGKVFSLASLAPHPPPPLLPAHHPSYVFMQTKTTHIFRCKNHRNTLEPKRTNPRENSPCLWLWVNTSRIQTLKRQTLQSKEACTGTFASKMSNLFICVLGHAITNVAISVFLLSLWCPVYRALKSVQPSAVFTQPRLDLIAVLSLLLCWSAN